ncbi:unnamed protein product [Durusdinium trenchii]|uniref:Uncharacterized methyltransferase C1347.09 n=2 Tax=Durusdinium trenchii TaxID=1381693 RepID=A0ABP0QZU2_9DINO
MHARLSTRWPHQRCATAWKAAGALQHLRPGGARGSTFDARANTWDTPKKVERVAWAARLVEARPWFRTQPEAMGRCLDFGTGTGLLAFELQRFCRKVVGVDTSEGMLQVMEDKIAAAELQSKMSIARRLGPHLGDFDLIVSMLAIHHVVDCGLQIKELCKHLAPGGRLVVVDFEATENAPVFHRFQDRKGDHYEHDGLAAQELMTWLEDAKLKNLDMLREPFQKEVGEGWPNAGEMETFQMLIASGEKEST